MRHPDLSDLRGRRVLVTGAASGIGRALAQACAEQGASLYLTDISEAGLAQVAEQTSAELALPADISDHDQVLALAAAVAERTDAMDIVANVAGISAWGSVERLEHRQWRAMVEVNLMGPIHVIESFVPPMIAAGRGGHLVNVSSAAGLIGLPWHAAYSASKFGLRGVSEVLRFDLEPHGIGVSLVCPGAVATPLTETVEIAGVDIEHPAIRRMQKRFVEHAASPEEVADRILDGVRRNRYLVHTAREIRLAFLLQRIAPPAYALVMRQINARFMHTVAKAPL